MRSGVNWIRPKEPEMVRARARTSSVLPSPGTPSTRTWPPASSAHSTASMTSRWPTSALPTSARMAAATLAAWTKFSSFIAEFPCSFPLVSSFQCAVDALGGVDDADELGAAQVAAGGDEALRLLGRDAPERADALGALGLRGQREIG